MKKIILLLLIFMLFSCSNDINRKNKQSNLKITNEKYYINLDNLDKKIDNITLNNNKLYIYGERNNVDNFINILDQIKDKKIKELYIYLKNIKINNTIENKLKNMNVEYLELKGFSLYGYDTYKGNKKTEKNSIYLGWYNENNIKKLLKESKFLKQVCIGEYGVFNCYKKINDKITIEYNKNF